MVAFVRAGKLAFDTMVAAGIKKNWHIVVFCMRPHSCNTIARKELFEMNRVISDTAEYGCYLFDHAYSVAEDFMKEIDTDVIGTAFAKEAGNGVDNKQLIDINEIIRFHPIELVGYELRESMTAMKKIV